MVDPGLYPQTYSKVPLNLYCVDSAQMLLDFYEMENNMVVRVLSEDNFSSYRFIVT